MKNKFLIINLFLKTLFNITPKKGDKVKVAVGFSKELQEGIVSLVGEGYCWIDRLDKTSFTASFCYCQFHYIP